MRECEQSERSGGSPIGKRGGAREGWDLGAARVNSEEDGRERTSRPTKRDAPHPPPPPPPLPRPPHPSGEDSHRRTLGAAGRRGSGEQGARVGGASVRRDGRCERTVRVGGASGRCATDGASGRRELATREAADKQTAETAGEMMARGSEGATVGGGGGARAERRVGGGRLGRGGARVRAVGLRSTSELGAAAPGRVGAAGWGLGSEGAGMVLIDAPTSLLRRGAPLAFSRSHERGNRVRAGGRGGVEWGTLSPDHRRRPRCAVVDQVERRARDSRELALELARVRELGDARAREVDVVQESYLWCGRRAASAGGG